MAMTYGSIDKKKEKIVTIEMWRGIVSKVYGLPKGYLYKVIDDEEEDEEKKNILYYPDDEENK
tara:strand:+ start:66 stop:254 length:189 start_codon:yes stop_codon:yes gene_type:complete